MRMDKYKELFFSECKERLEKMGNMVVSLEKEPKNSEMINEIFRNAHSIKGMAAVMGYQNMSKLSHRLEDLFTKIRNEESFVDGAVIDTILKSHSLLLRMLSRINEKGSDEEFSQEVAGELEPSAKDGKLQPKVEANVTRVFETASLGTKDPFVRVRSSHLDRLIDIISEFMSLKWRLKNFTNEVELVELEDELETLEKLIRDMNEKILSMRMVPLSVLTGKLPMVARDMARGLGKAVDFEVSGESVELDKNIIESLESPLIHMIRNCIGHGLESPAEREVLEKSSSGNLFFKAFRSQNRIIIEIGDDGRGIDQDRVVKRALEMAIIREDDLKQMDPNKKLLLVCVPGLSTSDKVGEVSGRGVGMDVVKSSIESLGGTLSIFSKPNVGTTFRIDLPLTTAIIKVFIVEVDGIQYGIPSVEVEKVAEIDASQVAEEDGIRYYESADGLLKRVNLHYLGEILHSTDGKNSKGVLEAVVIKNGNDRRMFVVDRLCSMEEVIVKPLSAILKFIKGVSGVTILPTGSPMFILNVEELV